MIPIKHHIDLSPSETSERKTLICSREINGRCEVATANNREIKLTNGLGDESCNSMNFTVDFNISKIMYYRVRYRSPHLRQNSKAEQEEDRQYDEYLTVCGDKVIVFIDLITFRMHHYAIPFKVREIHASMYGLLVERDIPPDRPHLKGANMFELYSLANPFAELLPVIYSSENSTDWKFCWQNSNEDSVLIGSEKNFVVTFNNVTKRHSIYRIRETDENEVRKAIRFFEDSRMNTFQTFNHTPFNMSPDVHSMNSLFTPPQNVFRQSDVPMFPPLRSPALQALSDAMDASMEHQLNTSGSSPFVQALTGSTRSNTLTTTSEVHTFQSTSQHPFTHSTPHNHNAVPNFGPTPSNADSSLTSSWHKSPMPRGTPGTPVVHKPPATLERNIHKRTLEQRGIQRTPVGTSTIGGNQTFRTPVVSRGAKRFDPDESKVETVKEFERMLRFQAGNTTKMTLVSNKEIGDLDREPDIDLLLAKISLEHVYTEPNNPDGKPSSKMFISSHLNRLFVNYLVGDELKIVRINKKRDANATARNEVQIITGKDASSLTPGGLTLVSKGASLVMYAGGKHIGLVCLDSELNVTPATRIYPCAQNSALICTESSVTRIFFAPKYNCAEVEELMTGVLQRVDERVRHVIDIAWHTNAKTPSTNTECPSVVDSVRHAVLFLLEFVGVNVKLEMDTTTNPDVQEDDDVASKQRKPKCTIDEVMRMIDKCLLESGDPVLMFQDENSVPDKDGDIRLRSATPSGETESEKLDNKKNEWERSLLPKDVRTQQDNEYWKYKDAVFRALHEITEDWILREDLLNLVVRPFLVNVMKIVAGAIADKAHFAYYSQLSTFGSFPDETALKTTRPVFSIMDFFTSMLAEEDLKEEFVPCLGRTGLRAFLVLAAYLGPARYFHAPERIAGPRWWTRAGLTVEEANAILKEMAESQHRDVSTEERMKGMEAASQVIDILRMSRQEILNLPIGLRALFMKIQSDSLGNIRHFEVQRIMTVTEENLVKIVVLRWKDLRMRNCWKMLDSSRPVLITQNSMPNRDQDVAMSRDSIDTFLAATSIRTFSQAFGRAMMDFRSEFPNILEPLTPQKLALTGLLYPARVVVEPVSTDTYKNHMDWANFYCGVASALRIVASDAVQLTTEWMMSPQMYDDCEPSAAAGMILGFGLNGHLKDMNMYYAHEMLYPFEKMKSIALLMGLAASKLATCDSQVYKILATHLPFLMGPTSLDIKIDMTIQTAAVSALGILFAGSGDTSLAKSLVNEIGRCLGTEESPVSDRSAYKLSCGFALGLIMLGKGNGMRESRSVPYHQPVPPISERLMIMVRGGPRDRCVFLPNLSINRIGQEQNENFAQTNHVKENGMINTHLASKPAIIALGLMHMKTNDKLMARQLKLPETLTELEGIRPDLIFFRLLSYYLILWDEIKMTGEWIESLVPEVVLNYLHPILQTGVVKTRQQIIDELHAHSSVDKETLAQVYMFSVTAACYLVALKNINMIQTEEERDRVMYIMEMYTAMICSENRMKRPGHSVLCTLATPVVTSTCASMMVQSMSLIKCASGDLHTMRFCRLLRTMDQLDVWPTAIKKHNEQVVAHMSIGMLFMGNGRFAFKQDDLSLALLIVSTVPTLSHHVSDNRHYHQPLRFLWALAVEPRLLVTLRDSDLECIKARVLINAVTEEGGNKIIELEAPCLLPPIDMMTSIKIGGDCYEQREFNLTVPEQVNNFRELMDAGLGYLKLRYFPAPVLRSENFHKTTDPIDLETIYFCRETNGSKAFGTDVQSIIELPPDFRLTTGSKYGDIQKQLSRYHERVMESIQRLRKPESSEVKKLELFQKVQHEKRLKVLLKVANLWGEDECELMDYINDVSSVLTGLA